MCKNKIHILYMLSTSQLIIKTGNKKTIDKFFTMTPRLYYEEFISIKGVFDYEFLKHENIRIYFEKQYNMIPKFILFIESIPNGISEKILKYIPETQIIFWSNDIHWFSSAKKQELLYGFTKADLIISHVFPDHFKQIYGETFYEKIDKKMIQFGNSCNSLFAKEKINFNSSAKIYFYGAFDKKNYPLRLNFINKMMKSQYNNLLIIQKNIGYNSNGIEHAKQTATQLYEYTFSFTTGIYPKFEIGEIKTSKYYLVTKFFEIMGSGVLLLCNHYGVQDQLEFLGFFNGIHYIHIDDQNFDQVLSLILDKSKQYTLNIIRTAGHDLTHKKYLTNICMNNLKLKLEQI